MHTGQFFFDDDINAHIDDVGFIASSTLVGYFDNILNLLTDPPVYYEPYSEHTWAYP